MKFLHPNDIGGDESCDVANTKNHGKIHKDGTDVARDTSKSERDIGIKSFGIVLEKRKIHFIQEEKKRKCQKENQSDGESFVEFHGNSMKN